MYELLTKWRDRYVRKAHEAHLAATLDQLAIIRAQFEEALSLGEALKAEADKVLIRATAYNLLAAENHIRAALGPTARR